MSPKDTFKLSTGDTMSFMEYYRNRYNVEIKDVDQPLLISRTKATEKNVERTHALIPELTYLTGLSEDMRNNFKVMKEIATFTRLSPAQRQSSLKTFIQSVNGHPDCRNLLDGWNLKLSDNLVTLNGRVLGSETLHFGKMGRAVQADWSSSLRALLTTVPLTNWVLTCPKSKKVLAQDFIKCMIDHGSKTGILVNSPQLVVWENDRIDTMLQEIKTTINQQVQLVVSIFPQQRSDRYAAFK